MLFSCCMVLKSDGRVKDCILVLNFVTNSVLSFVTNSVCCCNGIHILVVMFYAFVTPSI